MTAADAADLGAGTTSAAYLFTWDPERYPWDGFDAAMEALERTGTALVGWSIGDRTQVEPGADVFLMRQGGEGRGIVGHGAVAGDATREAHWDPPRREQGDTYRRVPVRWTSLSRRPLVDMPELHDISGGPAPWDTRDGGVPLDPTIASALAARLGALAADASGARGDAQGAGGALRILGDGAAPILSVAWSSSDRAIAAAYGDGTARIWDATTGAVLHDLTGHDGTVHRVAWSPEDGRIATAGEDGTARIWDAATGELVQQLARQAPPEVEAPVTWVAWSPDGTRIATAGHGRIARIWDAGTGGVALELVAPLRLVRVAWSHDGSRVATAGLEPTARTWDAGSGALLHAFDGHRGHIDWVAWSSDDGRIATVGEDGTARVWDAGSGALLHAFDGHRGHIDWVAWSSDDGRIATAGEDGTARVWDATTGELLQQLIGHRGTVYRVAWSDDGRIATAGEDGTARVWDATTGELLQQLTGHRGDVNRVAWSSDDGRIATAGEDGTARIWVPARLPWQPFAGFTHDDTHRRDLLAEDRLDITPHVRAYALLIASKQLRPPLATGLFGDWGAGKTFFMRALRQEIERLTGEARASGLPQHRLPVYRNIVQIEFNAWHYVDSDLWASLADSIFANLRIREDEDLTVTEERRRLYVNQLMKHGAALRQIEADREIVERQIELSRTRLSGVEQQVARQRLAVELAQDGVDVGRELGGEIDRALTEAGLPPVGRSAGELHAALAEARDVLVRGSAVTKTFEGRYGAGWLTIACLLLALGPAALLLTSALDWPAVGRVTSTFVAVATTVTALLRTATGAARRSVAHLEDLDERVTQAIDEDLPEDHELRKQLRELENSRSELLKEEGELRTRLGKIEQTLGELRPGRLLADFILSRQNSDDYRKHLGLAALIRRDFEELAALIEEFNQRLELGEVETKPAPSDADARTDAPPLDDGATAQQPDDVDEASYHVNRIVLYIDDLDRCPEEKVIEVLQAVHLLLAFPLFVVVVGVDARWLTRSLETKHAGLLDGGANRAAGSGGAATSEDYLEKIFQIPFWLRPMGPGSQHRLLDALTGIAYEDRRPVRGTDDATVAVAPDDAADSRDEQHDAPIGSVVARAGDHDGAALTPPAPGDPVRDDDATASNDGSVASARSAYGLRVQVIDIDAGERDFMQQLRPLLGRSPRSMTRFVNVYRLIRAVARYEQASRPDVDDLDERRIAMFLLAVVTGCPAISRDFFRALHHAADDETLRDVIAHDRAEAPNAERDADGSAGGHAQRGSAGRPPSRIAARQWSALDAWAAEHPEWGDARVASWRDWARQVARYSYRIEQS